MVRHKSIVETALISAVKNIVFLDKGIHPFPKAWMAYISTDIQFMRILLKISHRIGIRAVNKHFKMEMGTGGYACGADKCNLLSSGYGLAAAD